MSLQSLFIASTEKLNSEWKSLAFWRKLLWLGSNSLFIDDRRQFKQDWLIKKQVSQSMAKKIFEGKIRHSHTNTTTPRKTRPSSENFCLNEFESVVECVGKNFASRMECASLPVAFHCWYPRRIRKINISTKEDLIWAWPGEGLTWVVVKGSRTMPQGSVTAYVAVVLFETLLIPFWFKKYFFNFTVRLLLKMTARQPLKMQRGFEHSNRRTSKINKTLRRPHIQPLFLIDQHWKMRGVALRTTEYTFHRPYTRQSRMFS